MRDRGWPTLLVAAVILASGLTACAGRGESYCQALKDDRADLARLSAETSKKGGDGSAALNDTVSLLTGLAEKAPDAVDGEWRTLAEAMGRLADAVEASGAEPADFAGRERPEGVTEGQFAAVERAAGELRSLPVRQATQSIEQHAQEECQVDLSSQMEGGLGGTGGTG